jgi:hypothetical protein
MYGIDHLPAGVSGRNARASQAGELHSGYMGGGISWLLLVAAFAAVTALCGVLMFRLYRIGSSARPVPRWRRAGGGADDRSSA